MHAPTAKCRRGVYKYVIHEDVIFQTDIRPSEIYENKWIRMDLNGEFTVKGGQCGGYSWDGCSPKFNFFDLCLLGTPDGRIRVQTGKPVTFYASMAHDALLQFQPFLNITRKQADKVFLDYLGDFKARAIYYYAVRLFGKIKDFLHRT